MTSIWGCRRVTRVACSAADAETSGCVGSGGASEQVRSADGTRWVWRRPRARTGCLDAGRRTALLRGPSDGGAGVTGTTRLFPSSGPEACAPAAVEFTAGAPAAGDDPWTLPINEDNGSTPWMLSDATNNGTTMNSNTHRVNRLAISTNPPLLRLSATLIVSIGSCRTASARRLAGSSLPWLFRCVASNSIASRETFSALFATSRRNRRCARKRSRFAGLMPFADHRCSRSSAASTTTPESDSRERLRCGLARRGVLITVADTCPAIGSTRLVARRWRSAASRAACARRSERSRSAAAFRLASFAWRFAASACASSFRWSARQSRYAWLSEKWNSFGHASRGQRILLRATRARLTVSDQP